MKSRRPCRPSLKITQYADAEWEGYFFCEVWNPFASTKGSIQSRPSNARWRVGRPYLPNEVTATPEAECPYRRPRDGCG